MIVRVKKLKEFLSQFSDKVIVHFDLVKGKQPNFDIDDILDFYGDLNITYGKYTDDKEVTEIDIHLCKDPEDIDFKLENMMSFSEYEKLKGNIKTKEDAFEKGKQVAIAELADAMHLSLGFQVPLDLEMKINAIRKANDKNKKGRMEQGVFS